MAVCLIFRLQDPKAMEIYEKQEREAGLPHDHHDLPKVTVFAGRLVCQEGLAVFSMADVIVAIWPKVETGLVLEDCWRQEAREERRGKPPIARIDDDGHHPHEPKRVMNTSKKGTYNEIFSFMAA